MAGLSQGCLEKLCNIGVAAGIIGAGALGLTAAAGVLEALSKGGELALQLGGERRRRCRVLVASVLKQVGAGQQAWIAAEFGDDWAARADVAAALGALESSLHLCVPDAEMAVAARFRPDVLADALLARAAREAGPFRDSEIARRLFRLIAANTFTLIRVDNAFFNSFAIEGLGALLQGQDAAQSEAARRHEQQMAATRALQASLAREKGVDPRHLAPLFAVVGHDPNVPPERFEEAIREAVEVLLARARDPVAPSNDGAAVDGAIAAARARLALLDTDGAVDLLARREAEMEDARVAQARGQARLAVERAEILGAAYRHDEAIAAWRKAGELDGDDTYAHFSLGDALMLIGDLTGAMTAYQIAQVSSLRTGDDRDLSISHNKIGDVLRSQGDLDGALASFQESLSIRSALAALDPLNTDWQRDLSLSHNRIGDVMSMKGDLDGALVSFQNALKIRQDLAASDQNNTQLQRDMSVSHNRIGDILRVQGNTNVALTSFNYGLKISCDLVAREPHNMEWQRDLSVSHNRIGDVLREKGDLDVALVSFQNGLNITRQLAARDPRNTEWKRDLSYILTQIALTLEGLDNIVGALEAARESLAIDEALVVRDPTNVTWRKDVIISRALVARLERKD